MNIDTLLQQYFPSKEHVCIEMFDDRNIQLVYRRLVEVLIHQWISIRHLLSITEQTPQRNSTNYSWMTVTN